MVNGSPGASGLGRSRQMMHSNCKYYKTFFSIADAAARRA
jgi:hypothetical protein